MTTLKLEWPVESFDQEIAELTFRKPTGKDLRACGFPFIILTAGDDEQGGVLPQAGPIAKYVTRLAGVSMSAVDKMSVNDLFQATQIIMDFFGEEAGSSTRNAASNTTTTSPDSGE